MEMTPEPLSRPELDAKLQTLETRLDAKIDRLADKVDALSATVDSLIVTINDFRIELRDIHKEVRLWAVGAIATVITTTIAGMFGVWQIVAGVSQANIAAYESGRSVEKATAEAVRSIERLLADLEKQQKR